MKRKSLTAVAILICCHLGAQCFDADLKLSHLITGITNPEDLVDIPGSDWVLVSSMAGDVESSGAIFAINKSDNTVIPMFAASSGVFEKKTGLTKFAPHGIYLQRIKQNSYQFFVINHGSREATEIFELTLKQGKPTLTWQRHIDFPEHVYANGLVVTSMGKIYATCMYDPADTLFIRKFENEQPTGKVWEWTHDNGWTPFGQATFSGANGIAISPDESNLYISEWAAHRIHRLSIHQHAMKPASVTVDFLPDNIRWGKNSELIIAGQKSSPQELFAHAGLAEKIVHFRVIRLNPSSMAVEGLLDCGDETFSSATVAIEIENGYWIGCFGDNKIAIFLKR